MQSCIRTLTRKTRPGGDFEVEAPLPAICGYLICILFT